MSNPLLPRPFFLTIYPTGYADQARLPPHRLILEPLVAVASEIVVHQRRGYKFEVALPPHNKRGPDLVLDPHRDLVATWPAFWNAGGWKRGSIAITVPIAAVDWHSIFHQAEFGGVWSSRRQILKGTPSSAIDYADRTARGNLVVCCLSASNGIQWMDVWSPPERCDALASLAEEQCRRFVPFIANGSYSREIIFDREPYTEACALLNGRTGD